MPPESPVTVSRAAKSAFGQMMGCPRRPSGEIGKTIALSVTPLEGREQGVDETVGDAGHIGERNEHAIETLIDALEPVRSEVERPSVAFGFSTTRQRPGTCGLGDRAVRFGGHQHDVIDFRSRQRRTDMPDDRHAVDFDEQASGHPRSATSCRPQE